MKKILGSKVSFCGDIMVAEKGKLSKVNVELYGILSWTYLYGTRVWHAKDMNIHYML